MPSSTTITFHRGGWLENAGIVGIYRILGDQACQVEPTKLTISSDSLTDFADHYFKFFIQHYGKMVRFQRILDFETHLQKWQENDFADFTDDDLAMLDDWYQKVLKYSAKSKSYQATYPLIDYDLDVLVELKKIDKLFKQLNKKHFLKEHAKEAHSILREAVERIQKLINFFKLPASQKQFPAKTLSYSVVNNAWDGVAMFNPSEARKFPDFYANYQQHFVEPAIEYLNEDHSKDKYTCSTCGRPMKKQKIAYSFINGMGYDVNRKTSNAWNFDNENFMCPICQLMYSCVSAGMNYNMAKQGLFINNNHSIADLINANDLVLETMTEQMNEHRSNISPFRAFSTSFLEQLNLSNFYSIANIQVITYDNEQFAFTVIPPLAARVIARASKIDFGKNEKGKNLLSFLYSAGIRQFRGINYFNIYDEVIRRLFNSTNLYSLIYQLELLINAQSKDVRYTPMHIMDLINLNTLFFQELLPDKKKEGAPIMKVTQEELSHMRYAGMKILEYYQSQNATQKASALVYKLLQALNSNNIKQFMSILLRVSASQHQLVPSNLVNNVNQPEVFQQYALAFIAGLINKD